MSEDFDNIFHQLMDKCPYQIDLTPRAWLRWMCEARHEVTTDSGMFAAALVGWMQQHLPDTQDDDNEPPEPAAASHVLSWVERRAREAVICDHARKVFAALAARPNPRPAPDAAREAFTCAEAFQAEAERRAECITP